jgi:fermentation-respiration switch protein FrsA (DUF1100 family)
VKLLLGLVLTYAAICLVLFLMQRRLQYLPDPSRPQLPGQPPYSSVREVELETEDGLRLGAWHWPAESRGELADLTIVLFHGNAGHRGHRLEWMRALASTGAGVLQVDYRGYGGNPGTPTEKGLYRDGDAAVRFAREQLGDQAARLVFLGQSLGAGVAVEMAARHGADGLILQNAAATLVDLARGAYPWLPAGLLLRDRFAAIERIPSVRCPLLAIHGQADRIVPIGLGRRLYEAAPGPKTWWAVPEAGHNDLLEAAGPEYLRRVGAFLRDLGGAPGETAR